MKFAVLLTLLTPVFTTPLQKPDNLTRNDFINNGCADVILFYSRGTFQAGNMGHSPGPAFAHLIEERYGPGHVAVQGLGSKIRLWPNIFRSGATRKAVELLKQHVVNATASCPRSQIVLGGFSQGAAVIRAACKTLPKQTLQRVSAIVTFGSTRMYKSGHKLPNYPQERTLMLCNRGDLICEKGIMILNRHHSKYGERVVEAAQFVFRMLDADDQMLGISGHLVDDGHNDNDQTDNNQTDNNQNDSNQNDHNQNGDNQNDNGN